ncbi:hypothetical protein J2W21_003020 [Sinomonas atrocyanea]|uniref:hypothetical protein n=1 Tax=Sinomonas atrocyanea TaxID=37927 RepID=UPI002781A7EE|nr:hypothetical protein [Sinomonas atrocyanea]MDP9885497.1 hypothetical protein [Sinomonas atrocyanea]
MPEVVVPLTYAGATPQSRRDVYGYKGDPPNLAAVRRLSILMYYFTVAHWGCIQRFTRMPVTSVVTVPSGRGRKPHPLEEFVTHYFSKDLLNNEATFVGQPREGRGDGIRPDDFGFTHDPKDQHVLVVEDSWVSGSNALSVAIQARRAGAMGASVLCLARYLREDDQVTKRWSATDAARKPFDPSFCPVTRGECPPPLDNE